MDSETSAAVQPNTPTPNNTRLFVLLFALALLGGTALFAGRRASGTLPRITTPPPAAPTAPAEAVATATSAQTLIYGRWSANSSEIRAVNNDGTRDTLLARLPLAIKDVNVVSSAELIYIADTDPDDHGRRIVLYNLDTQKERTVASAEENWGIDDLIVSPDKSWIAWWEVQLGPNGQLVGGRSRVYSYLLNTPNPPNRIFNELATNTAPIHYPLFFDHDNNLYSDGYIPNGGGWNLELVRTAADGGNRTLVLSRGSYNSDPRLHPVRNLIVYTAYNPSAAAIFSAQKTGLFAATSTGLNREDLLNRNDVRVYDLETARQRSLLSEDGRYYNDAVWSSDGESVIVRSFGHDGAKLTDAQATRVLLETGEPRPLPGEQPAGVYLADSPDGLVAGVPLDTGGPANLGASYAPQLVSIMIYPEYTQTTTRPIVAGTSQYIALVNRPAERALGMRTSASQNVSSSIKLKTITFKPELAQRSHQQNDGTLPAGDKMKCKDLYDYLKGKGEVAQGAEYKQWVKTIDQSYVPGYKCYDSPLYLYPPQPAEVSVRVKNAIVLSATPRYDRRHGWRVLADPSGLLRTGADSARLAKGPVFDKIEYAYAASSTKPAKGYVFARSQLAGKLRDYGRKLGLVGRETEDFVAFWTGRLPAAPYYFVSHFASPSRIVEFQITPEPDTFIQAIMYFKPLSFPDFHHPPDPPEFPSVPARTGFTVVDWSGVIDTGF